MKQRKDLAPEVDDALQHIFDEGNRIDELAKQLFPGGVDVDGFGFQAADDTKKAIESGATALYQPTFIAGDLQCRGDILVKNGDAWDLYEVKSSTKVKEEHIADAGFQVITMERAGLVINRIFIVHVNNQYVREGDIDPGGILTKTEVTREVRNEIPVIEPIIPRALAVAHDWEKTPGKLHLESCRDPYKCEFLPCYIGEFEDDHIYAIASELDTDRVKAFLERGLLKPEQVPPEKLEEIGAYKVPHDHSNPTVEIQKEMIQSELEALEYPLYFFDYETVNPAIPPYDGYRPYQMIPFQYSLHILHEPGGQLEHKEFLAEHDEDPAEALVKALREHAGDTGSFISWNAPFERTRNKELAQRLPEYASFLYSVNERMYDLMHIVKKGYYVDSRFEGSASIKKVLPVLVPELTYKNLVIQEGGTASRSWFTLIDPNTPEDEREELKKNMLAYCERDTEAMVRLLEVFKSQII